MKQKHSDFLPSKRLFLNIYNRIARYILFTFSRVDIYRRCLRSHLFSGWRGGEGVASFSSYPSILTAPCRRQPLSFRSCLLPPSPLLSACAYFQVGSGGGEEREEEEEVEMAAEEEGGREGGDDPDPQTKEAGEEEIGLPSIDTRVLNLQIRTGNISRELEMLSNDASNLRVAIDDLEQNPVDPACLLFLWLATVPPPPPPPRHTDGGAARPSAPAASSSAHRKSDGRRPRLLSPFFLFFLLSLLPEAPAGEEPTSEDYSCESPKISCRRYQKCE